VARYLTVEEICGDERHIERGVREGVEAGDGPVFVSQDAGRAGVLPHRGQGATLQPLIDAPIAAGEYLSPVSTVEQLECRPRGLDDILPRQWHDAATHVVADAEPHCGRRLAIGARRGPQ